MESRSPSKATLPLCLLDFDSFYISRVLGDVALVTVGAVKDLRSAKAMMRRMATRVPGAYLIFHGSPRRVISRLVRPAGA